MKSELDFLIPTGINSVPSLIGEFDSTLSNFKGTAGGVDSDPFKEITCKKVNASIAFELSDIQIESPGDGPSCKEVIRAVGILSRSPLGRIYNKDAKGDLVREPYVLAEIEIMYGQSGSYIEFNHSNVLDVTLRLDEGRLIEFAEQLRRERRSSLMISVELWVSDEKQSYIWAQSGKLQIEPTELILIDNIPSLTFSLDELMSVQICRLEGKELHVDSGSIRSAPASRNALFRSVIIIIEIIAGIMLVYWNFPH